MKKVTIVFGLLFMILVMSSIANAAWYDPNWRYRRSHDIGNITNAGTDYQVEIKFYYQNGTDTDDTIYLNNTVDEYILSVSSANHENYGLAYPVTYIFDIPAAETSAKVYYRYNVSETWTQLTEKAGSDHFDGIDAVRFNYTTDTAYVSIAYSNYTDEIHLRFTNSSDDPIRTSYDRIPLYYDDRKAAVTITADDWNNRTLAGKITNYRQYAFELVINETRSREMWFTGGVITATPSYEPVWSLIQPVIDAGYVELASHSRTHPHVPYPDYDIEINGSKQDLIANLTLPALNTMGDNEYVYAWLEPYGESNNDVRTTLGQNYYLCDRTALIGNGFSAWNAANNIYDEVGYTIRIGTDGTQNLTELNTSFDTAYAADDIYHLMMHPVNVNMSSGSNETLHFDHISNRTDVWYVGWGHMYLYHYVDQQDIVTVTPVLDRSNMDFSDIRFTDDDEVTLLDHWVDDKRLFDGENATFWVKINDNLNTTNATIYIYYGNPNALSASDGTATFLFFDNFSSSTLDATLWDINATGNITGSTADGYYEMVESYDNGADNNWWPSTNARHGNQHHAIWTPTVNFGFITEYWSSMLTAPASDYGIGGVGIIGTDTNVTAAAMIWDAQTLSIIARVRGVAEENVKNSIIFGISPTENDLKIVINTSSNITLWYRNMTETDFTRLDAANLTADIANLSILAGDKGNNFPDYIRIDNVRTRKYANPESDHGVWGAEEDVSFCQGNYTGGDWTISTTIYCQNEEIVLTGDLLIQSGGSLTLSNITLNYTLTEDGQYNITVESGGIFGLWNYTVINSTNSNFEYVIDVQSGSSFEMNDSRIEDAGYDDDYMGLRIGADNVNITNSNFTGNYVGVHFDGSSIPRYYFVNSTITNSGGYDVALSNGANVVALNVSFNRSTTDVADTSILTRRWFVDVHTIYDDSSIFPNVLVRVRNISGHQVLFDTTDANGDLRRIDLVEFDEGSSGINDWNNYTFSGEFQARSGSNITNISNNNVDSVYISLGTVVGGGGGGGPFGQLSGPAEPEENVTEAEPEIIEAVFDLPWWLLLLPIGAFVLYKLSETSEKKKNIRNANIFKRISRGKRQSRKNFRSRRGWKR
jgi:hypothetical protein